MKGKLITIVGVESGDWEGLYVDGELDYEGHSIYSDVFIELIRKYKVFKGVNCLTITDEQMEYLGCNFPHKLEDVNKGF